MQEFDAGQTVGWALAVLAAFWGRAMAMAMLRPVVGRQLLWEIPVVIGMGTIGSGAADWLDWHGAKAGALIAVLGYLGPGSVIPLIRMVLRKEAS